MPDSYLQRLIDRPNMVVGPLTVDPRGLVISLRGQSQRLELKVMALLVLLADKADQTCTRSDLLDAIWPGHSAGDESLTRLAYQLRKALTCLGDTAVEVKTVPKIGYILQVPKQESANPSSTSITGTHALADLPKRVDRSGTSIAVFPVEDFSPERTGMHLANGITRDLTNLLSHNPRLRIAASSSVLHYVQGTKSMAAAIDQLGVQYVVSASLNVQDNRLRLRAELIDCADESIAWSGKFDSPLDSFFEVQDELARQISAAVSVTVNTIQSAAQGRSSFDLSAYERVQAAEALRVNYSRENADQILVLLEEARSIAPDDPIVLGSLAIQLSQHLVSQWLSDPAKEEAKAVRLIKKALKIAPEHSEVQSAAGVVFAMLKRPTWAIPHLQRAVQINPNDVQALAVLGWQMCLLHADQRGIGLIEQAEKCAPHHPRFGLWATYRGTGHCFLLNFPEAVTACEEARARAPNYYQPNLSLAWALTGAGNRDLAREYIDQAVAMEGPHIPERFVAEMRQWVAASPNSEKCREVLTELSNLAAAMDHSDTLVSQ